MLEIWILRKEHGDSSNCGDAQQANRAPPHLIHFEVTGDPSAAGSNFLAQSHDHQRVQGVDDCQSQAKPLRACLRLRMKLVLPKCMLPDQAAGHSWRLLVKQHQTQEQP